MVESALAIWIEYAITALAAGFPLAALLGVFAYTRGAAPAAAPAPPVRRAPDYRAGLAPTRSGLIGRLESLLRGRSAFDAAALEDVEGVLFGADLGVKTAEDLMQTVRGLSGPDELRGALEARALDMLGGVRSAPVHESSPHVILVVGVNGSGKTTSIGKLAARWTGEGKKVLLAAADTYRAAAIDQLEIWSERAGAEIVKGVPGGDPAAVAFDAVKAGRARSADVILIDTAGRLQTDAGLMDELAKIVRVIRKDLPEAPHEVLLVVDANTGQNAIRQAEEFSRAVDVSGIVLSKLDGTAKGGVVLGIAGELRLPVRYVGMGEGVDDLHDFDPDAFVQALFAEA